MLGKFTDLNLARKFSQNTKKMSVIILGDDNRYWVVKMAKANELTKSGYQTIS